MVKHYELMVLVPAQSTADAIKNFVAKVTALVEGKGGKVLTQESLGRRQMAYQINKQSEAFYLLFTLQLDSSVTQAIEREIRLSDEVMRSLLTILETKKRDVPAALPKEEPTSATLEA